MVNGLGVHGADDADVVSNFGEVWQEVGVQPLAALPSLFKIEC